MNTDTNSYIISISYRIKDVGFNLILE